MGEKANNTAALDENQNVRSDEAVPPSGAASSLISPPAKKRKKKKLKWIIAGAVVLIIAAFAFRLMSGMPAVDSGQSYSLDRVTRRDITVSLSGSGTLEPADSYTVTTLIEGEILEDTFEEGDMVNKDDLLYQVDNSAASKNIERAEMSLGQNERSYQRLLESLDDLNIKADESGTILSLDVEVGDDINAGQQLGTIRNSSVMVLEIFFTAEDARNFSSGDDALVTVDGSFETITGTVSKVSAVDEIGAGNMLVRRVSIDVSNPGAILPDQAATAMVGDIACNGSGTFAYKAEAPIVARAAGKISKIALKEGGFASKGQTILTITSDTLSDQVSKAYDSLQDSRLTLEDRYDMLEEYTVKSPISGTIIEKNYKKGDTLSAGKALCTIYDLSYLTMTLNVDELDISKVSVGQKVQITAEAVESKTFEGEVTKVNIKGNTVNGVTSYPVTIRVDNAEDLLPGMNVDANIVIEGKEDVLAVPISALTRGNRVLVQTDPTADGTQMGEDGTPVGFEYTEVETGISDEDYIEIKSGLQEGQTVALVRVFTQNNTLMMPGGQMVAVSGPAGGAPIERQGGAGSGGGMR